MSEESSQKDARVLVGRVASDRMDKTVVVIIERRVKHGLYGKYIRRSTRLKVHDADNTARSGDLVSIAACRPLSRDKHFRLVDVIERATVVSPAG